MNLDELEARAMFSSAVEMTVNINDLLEIIAAARERDDLHEEVLQSNNEHRKALDEANELRRQLRACAKQYTDLSAERAAAEARAEDAERLLWVFSTSHFDIQKRGDDWQLVWVLTGRWCPLGSGDLPSIPDDETRDLIDAAREAK